MANAVRGNKTQGEHPASILSTSSAGAWVMSDSLIAKDDNSAWTGALRGAISARDEALYRRRLMQFLDTPKSFSFIEALIRRPAALAVMRRSYRALAAPLRLTHPNDLVAWMRNDEATPMTNKDGARDVVSMALPYFRFARGWARAAHKDSSYAIALAMMFFEPVLQLCEAPAKAAPQSASVAAVREPVQAPTAHEALPTFAHLSQRG
jgi:hypothetical protein